MKTTVAKALKDMKEAKRIYEEAKWRMLYEVRSMILEAPEDKPILNKDLAERFGLSPLHMGALIRTANHGDIFRTTVPKVRHFIEVDEFGNTIGDSVEQVTELVAYFGKRA